MVKQNQKIFNAFLVVIDIVCVLTSIILPYCLCFRFLTERAGYGFWLRAAILSAISLCLVLSFYFSGLYGSRRYKRFLRELFAIVCCSFAISVTALLIAYAISFPGGYPPLAAVSAFCFILLDGGARYFIRLVLRIARKKGYNLKFLLMIGGGDLASQFVKRVAANPQYGYRFAGCLTDGPGEKKQFAGIPVLGPVSSLKQHIPGKGIDEVVIALELKEYGKIPKIIAQCEKNGVKANIVPAYFQYIPSNPQMDEFDGMPVMALRKIPLTNPFYAALKRIFDITGALVCITLFSPVLLISWAVIRCTTGEAAVFRQERIGYNLKPFTMYKFRSMLPGAEGRWTAKNDSRRTKFGVFIRKLSIDELPQFFNVLSGKMSIIGPRPEIAEFVKQFKERVPRYMVRHQVKPGITGWAQIHNLRGDTSIEERIKNDIYYIENWSPILDIQIIICTILYAFYNPNE